MSEYETDAMALLSSGAGTTTLLGSSGAVKERIRLVREQSGASSEASCGGVGGGWGNAPAEMIQESCGGSGGGWGNSPEF